MSGGWVEPDRRDSVVDFVAKWGGKTELPLAFFTRGLGISRSKFYEWKKRYGCDNQHNGSVPRDFWLEEWEKEAIINFYAQHPGDGYRRCCYMMIDADLVAASPATVYRVLSQADAMRRWNRKPSRKGLGFEQPIAPHEHWHVDLSYVNIRGTFYYLCCVLDGCSRYIVHWEIRESMAEWDVQIVIQRAKERFPQATPRVISDNGAQFTAREFKEFIRINGMTHVRTSPYYPQSNGKIERLHGTIKTECIRPQTPLSLEDARRVVGNYVHHYNDVRLHGAIGYVTPKDRLENRQQEILARRDQRLEQAREKRRQRRAALPDSGHGQSESAAFLDHNSDAPQDRQGIQVEAGISAPCGPEQSEVMPEVYLNGPPGRGMSEKRPKDGDQDAPTHLSVIGQ